jgi:hypothetical protein
MDEKRSTDEETEATGVCDDASHSAPLKHGGKERSCDHERQQESPSGIRYAHIDHFVRSLPEAFFSGRDRTRRHAPHLFHSLINPLRVPDPVPSRSRQLAGRWYVSRNLPTTFPSSEPRQ